MNIQDYKNFYQEKFKNKTKENKIILICIGLDYTLDQIEFLENIYRTSGKYYRLCSDGFQDKALSERQELCQKSSALYSMLAELNGKNNTTKKEIKKIVMKNINNFLNL